MAGVHVTLANWYDLHSNLSSMTWSELAPNVHEQLLGHQGLIAAILQTRTYKFLLEQEQGATQEPSVVNEAALVQDTDEAELGPAGKEELATALDSELIVDGRDSAGLFDTDDVLYPTDQHELLQLLQQSTVIIKDIQRLSIRGTRYSVTPLSSLTSPADVIKSRSLVRFVQDSPTQGVVTGVGVMVGICKTGQTTAAEILHLPYSMQLQGIPLVPRYGLHSVLVRPNHLCETSVVIVPCGQVLNPVILDAHPESHRRYNDGTLLCYALNVNAERHFQ